MAVKIFTRRMKTCSSEPRRGTGEGRRVSLILPLHPPLSKYNSGRGHADRVLSSLSTAYPGVRRAQRKQLNKTLEEPSRVVTSRNSFDRKPTRSFFQSRTSAQTDHSSRSSEMNKSGVNNRGLATCCMRNGYAKKETRMLSLQGDRRVRRMRRVIIPFVIVLLQLATRERGLTQHETRSRYSGGFGWMMIKRGCLDAGDVGARSKSCWGKAARG